MMKSEPGTYALIFQSQSAARVQIGRWRQLNIESGYYSYVGSAFGPGGMRARVARHCRTDKPKHWHIDYLHEFVVPLAVWVSYEPEKLEHQWAQAFYEKSETSPVPGFGCSDCSCYSHLFYTVAPPEATWLGKVDSSFLLLPVR
jgi:Uri superfamily endonuclease